MVVAVSAPLTTIRPLDLVFTSSTREENFPTRLLTALVGTPPASVATGAATTASHATGASAGAPSNRDSSALEVAVSELSSPAATCLGLPAADRGEVVFVTGAVLTGLCCKIAALAELVAAVRPNPLSQLLVPLSSQSVIITPRSCHVTGDMAAVRLVSRRPSPAAILRTSLPSPTPCGGLLRVWSISWSKLSKLVCKKSSSCPPVLLLSSLSLQRLRCLCRLLVL